MTGYSHNIRKTVSGFRNALPDSRRSTPVLLDKQMLADCVTRAAPTCQHCFWPGGQRRDKSFQGVLFPYPFIIYLLGALECFSM